MFLVHSDWLLKLRIVSDWLLKLRIVSDWLLKLRIVSDWLLKLRIVSDWLLKLRIVSDWLLKLGIVSAIHLTVFCPDFAREFSLISQKKGTICCLLSTGLGTKQLLFTSVSVKSGRYGSYLPPLW